jgi:hypothetical protein
MTLHTFVPHFISRYARGQGRRSEAYRTWFSFPTQFGVNVGAFTVTEKKSTLYGKIELN